MGGEREMDVYSWKMQTNRRSIVHQGCSVNNNNQTMKYILEITKTTFNLGKIRKTKEKEREKHTRDN